MAFACRFRGQGFKLQYVEFFAGKANVFKEVAKSYRGTAVDIEYLPLATSMSARPVMLRVCWHPLLELNSFTS